MTHDNDIPRIALLLLGCDSLTGGGGAERQFTGVFNAFRSLPNPPFSVSFVTTKAAARTLRAAGLLTTDSGVITSAKIPAWKLSAATDSLALAWTLTQQRFDLVHCIMPSYMHAPGMALYSRFKGHTALTMNFTDCTVAHRISDPDYAFDNQVLSYRAFLKHVRLDGIFSWYESVLDALADGTLPHSGTPFTAAARYCFTNLARFKPGKKENTIVFAARMVNQKHPDAFIEAVKLLTIQAPRLVDNWTFKLYGDGPLRPALEQEIQRHRLSPLIQMGMTDDMAPVFAASRAFVSMQDFENFTSLSMLEAMACGNAVIARSVGQTDRFVRHKENGYLTRNSSPQALAEALLCYMENKEAHTAMAEASVRIATQEHTVENFMHDISDFWRNVLKKKG